MQFSATLCECRLAESPSVSNAVQRSENPCKNSFLNYESPALTAELQAHLIPDIAVNSILTIMGLSRWLASFKNQSCCRDSTGSYPIRQ